ncbi:MAG: metal-dependent hydrolase [Candidatus Thorarchaeota archaeon]
MSPGYTTHFFVGLLLSLPFYRLDRKDRLKTLLAGAFAGVLPDIDGIFRFMEDQEDPTLQFFFSHRGFWHSPIPPVIFIILAIIYLGIIYFFVSHETSVDHFWTLSAVALAWISHLVLDFGFTPYPYLTSPVWFFPLSDIMVYVLDQIAAIGIIVLLTWALWNYYFPLFYIDVTQQRKRTKLQARQEGLPVQNEIDDFIGERGFQPLTWLIIKKLLKEEKVAIILIIIFFILLGIVTIYVALI